MNTLEFIYAREWRLARLTTWVGAMAWILLIVATGGLVLVCALLVVFMRCLMRSLMLAHVRGNAMEIGTAQQPDLLEQVAACSMTLQVKTPRTYLLHGDQRLYSHLLQSLCKDHLFLLSAHVEAAHDHPQALRYRIGRAVGAMRRRQRWADWLRLTALWLPIVGPAYGRARVLACDADGRRCCANGAAAARAAMIDIAGRQQWPEASAERFAQQALGASSVPFVLWRLLGNRPSQAERIACLLDTSGQRPAHTPLACLLAALIPNVVTLKSALSAGLWVLCAWCMLALTLPQVENQQIRYRTRYVWEGTQAARGAIEAQLLDPQLQGSPLPSTLDELGLPERLPKGEKILLDPHHLSLKTKIHVAGWLGREPRYFNFHVYPKVDNSGKIEWKCAAEIDIHDLLPTACRDQAMVFEESWDGQAEHELQLENLELE